MALKMNVQRSFRDRILRSTFFNLQKTKRIISARDDRHHTITGVGMSINLPNAPEVLMNKVAMFSKKNCL